MAVTGDVKNRVQAVYVPIGSVLTTIVALVTFWVAFSNQLDAKFSEMQKEIRTIREVIVEQHGQLPR